MYQDSYTWLLCSPGKIGKLVKVNSLYDDDLESNQVVRVPNRAYDVGLLENSLILSALHILYRQH